MVSENTREGRVLKVLLDKLEAIRKELGSDKVFDIIGRQFTGKSLSDLIFEAVVEGKETQAEAVALAEVIRREEAEGAIKIEDVSASHLKAGFDLKVTRADGAMRYVEVKGRSGEGAVEMTVNEYIQAGNHRDKYWLYVVYNSTMNKVS